MTKLQREQNKGLLHIFVLQRLLHVMSFNMRLHSLLPVASERAQRARKYLGVSTGVFMS